MPNHHDELFRSHFEHANQLADRSYEQVRRAYEFGRDAGADRSTDASHFEDVEKDLEGGWLNVRVACGDWASVREFVKVGFDAARQGRIDDAPPAGDADIPPYADPLGANESRL